MNHLSEYHQYLLAGKITGTLTEPERTELEHLLRNDAGVHTLYMEMMEQLPEEMVKNQFGQLNEPGFWKDAETFRPKKSFKIKYIRSYAAAAIVLGFAIGMWWWFQPGNVSKNVTASKKNDAGVQLKLASGKLIDLSKQQGTIKEGKTALFNNTKSLTYSTDESIERTGVNTVMVPAGMDYKITLSDGSEIWMNSVTRLEFPFHFTGNTREITITGEAYCKITTDKTRPFIVHLPGSTVKVLGTEFNVNSYDRQVNKVALVEGAVQMTSRTGAINLKPGMQGVADAEGAVSHQPFNSKSVLGWQKGLYYFEYADVNEISRVVKRWYNTDIKIDNQALYKKRIKGLLNKHKPLQLFLDDIKFIAKIDSYFDKNGVLHFK